MDGGDDDRISDLPDGVLGEIVTRLPTLDAVRVQVLSTRWRHIWRSSPLNLRLPCRNYYAYYTRIVPGILNAHPGPGRRLVIEWPYNNCDDVVYSTWLWSPALRGLQELEINHDPGTGYRAQWVDKTALPERALFHYASTLRLLKIGYHTFPSAAAVAALRLPHLELISFDCVDISAGALQRVLAGCPALKTLVLDGCAGFAAVRINSPTLTSFAISPIDSYRAKRIYEDSDDDSENLRKQVVIIIVEDAPLLEKLVPFRRHRATVESLRLRVVSAPRLRVLGSLSSAIPKVQVGGTVFELTTRRVNRVTRYYFSKEKCLLMQAVMLATALRTVKIFAVEDVDSFDVVINYIKCFPCLEKLYISASPGFKGAARYDEENPIECLEHHLKMVALDGCEGKIAHVKIAKFFVRNARLLEVMKFRIFGRCQPGTSKEWIEDQQRKLLQIANMDYRHVKFDFLHDATSYQVVYCGKDIDDLSVHIQDSSRDDPFDKWFESEKEASLYS